MKNVIAKFGIEMVERGWLPEAMVSRAARRLCAVRLSELQQIEKRLGRETALNEFVEMAKQGPIAPVPEKANEQHYEVPADFYQLILGPALKYSCCYFDTPETTLAEAEQLALQQTCRRAQIEDGMEILELGCGWGSLTLHIAQNYPNCQITAVSNSNSQREFIIGRAEKLGVAGRLTVVTQDMNQLELDQRFDRIVSVEMFEHMRNYERLLANISSWLKPSGKLFVHIFCHKKYAYEFQTDGAANWMGQYFFSGGIMPSSDIFDYFQNNMRVTNQWTWSGIHYQKTCAAWREKLRAKRQQALPVLARVYGTQQAKRWFNRWILFLTAGAELFGFEDGQQWQVNHYLLEPNSHARLKSSQRSIRDPLASS